MNCIFRVIPKDQIAKIKPLWEKLNKIHLADSRYFKDHYESFTFEKRCEKFPGFAENNIRIEVIEDNETIVGYCISTVNESVGEIDSLFIEEDYRSYGYGGELVGNSIAWLKKNNCREIIVAVAEGHESVFGFYQKHRFYPRLTYLQLKD